MGKKNTVCLSAQTLTSRYQSIVDNWTKIECASDVGRCDGIIHAESPHLSCNVGSMRLLPECPLKSTEVKNCSQIIRAILISSFRTSSCCQASFPTIIRPMLYLWRMTSKIEFYSVEFNWSIFFSLYCLIVSRKTDHFLREIVRSKILFWWLNVNPSSFVASVWFAVVPTSSLGLWFCFLPLIWLQQTLTLVCGTWSSCGSAGISVLSWFESIHMFDRSIGYSDPRLRIVLIHRPNSNFTSIFEVLKKLVVTFQYRSNPHISLNPILLVVKMDRLEERVYSRQATERNCL